MAFSPMKTPLHSTFWIRSDRENALGMHNRCYPARPDEPGECSRGSIFRQTEGPLVKVLSTILQQAVAKIDGENGSVNPHSCCLCGESRGLRLASHSTPASKDRLPGTPVCRQMRAQGVRVGKPGSPSAGLRRWGGNGACSG
jgi:hypothetical protein